jgi:hypothetical protein
MIDADSAFVLGQTVGADALRAELVRLLRLDDLIAKAIAHHEEVCHREDA